MSAENLPSPGDVNAQFNAVTAGLQQEYVDGQLANITSEIGTFPGTDQERPVPVGEFVTSDTIISSLVSLDAFDAMVRGAQVEGGLPTDDHDVAVNLVKIRHQIKGAAGDNKAVQRVISEHVVVEDLPDEGSKRRVTIFPTYHPVS